jgi:hypothetical protein
MAMLAISAIGAGIGAGTLGTGIVTAGLFGGLGMTGTAIGWAAGGILGNLLGIGQPKTHSYGPRLGDLSVQASTYGTAKPVIYGSWRTSGNVIFCTDKREVATTTSRGKGGPKQKSTTYSYNVDMAVALCANEIAGIRKIFLNGKLIYDKGINASTATKVASSANAATFTIYYGTETQDPDPTMESTLGAGNVPGYRGMAYVVFGQLDCPNGQVPQLSFEVVASGSVADLWENVYTSSGDVNGYGIVLNDQYLYTASSYTTGLGTLETYNIADPEAPSLVNSLPVAIALARLTQGDGYLYTMGAELFPAPQKLKIYSTAVASSPVEVGSLDYSAFRLGRSALNYPYLYAIGASGARKLAIFNVANPSAPTYQSIIDTTGVPTDVIVYSSYVYVTCEDNVVRIYNVADPLLPSLLTSFAVSVVPQSMAVDGTTLFIANHNSPRVLQAWDLSSPLSPTLISQLGLGSLPLLSVRVESGVAYVSASGYVYVVNVADTANMALRVTGTVPVLTYQDVTPREGYIYSIGVKLNVSLFTENAVTQTDPQLATVLIDICGRSGIPSASITASTLGTLKGYALTSVATGRANLDPLLQAYDIQPLEYDGKLVFVLYSSLGDTYQTVTYDELGAAADDLGDEDFYPLERTLENELPRSVAVNYVSYESDYQPGTEIAQRSVTEAYNDTVLDVAVALTANQAAAAADRVLYRSWVNRSRRTARVPRKYAMMDAGDRVVIEYPRGTYEAKQIVSAKDDGAVCEWELIPYDGATAFGGIPTGVNPSTFQDGVSIPSPTQMAILDIPILRAEDDDPGLYVGLAGYSDNWSGAQLFVGLDEDSLATRGGVSTGTVMGSSSTALPTWTEGGMDMHNSVTVTLVNGELTNATRDQVLDSYTNLALLGDEIIGFMSAVNTSGKTWVLTGLLRGARGTERTVHTSVERFVMLQFAGLLRPVFDLATVGQPFEYLPVSIGRALDSQASVSFANTAIGLRPFAPVNLRRTTSGTDITLTWDRRTRSTVTFPANQVDVPLFEDSEAYTIDVYSGTTVVGTVTCTAETVTITGAEQTSFGLTPGDPIKVAVRMVSESYGPGLALEQTI